jgi:hypothetical protein
MSKIVIVILLHHRHKPIELFLGSILFAGNTEKEFLRRDEGFV